MLKLNKKLFIVILLFFAFSSLLIYKVSILPRSQSVYVQVEKVLLNCTSQDTSLYYACFRQHLNSLVHRFGVNPIINSLQLIFKNTSFSSGSQVSCHDLSHLVGEVAINQGADLGKTLVRCTTSCQYGCVHGALIAGISKNPNLLDNLSSVCLPFSENNFYPQEKDACEHGLGHALSEFSDMNLLKSLSLCNRLDTLAAKSKCAEGVFMQITDYPSIPYFQIDGSISHFCLSLPSEFTAVCYETASLHEYGRSKDVVKSLHVCDEVPEEYYSKCLIALVNLLYSNYHASPQKIMDFCERPDIRDYHACLLGAIQPDIIADPNAQVSLILCSQSTGQSRNICFRMLGQRYQYVYGLEKKNVFCANLSPEFKSFCLSDEK